MYTNSEKFRHKRIQCPKTSDPCCVLCVTMQDQRSTVISLHRLIVREVANEERGLFLITVGMDKPEMVEVYASSKVERNTWIQLIQDAMQSM